MKIALLVCALLASAQQPTGNEEQLRDIQQALARATMLATYLVHVDVFVSTAVVRGRTVATATINGAKTTSRLRFIDVFLKRQSAWQAVASQATPLPSGRLAAQQRDDDIPISSVPQNLPCPDQSKSLKEVTDAFDSGRVPSPSEMTGTWVLIRRFYPQLREVHGLFWIETWEEVV